MNARNDVKRPSVHNLNARLVLAAVQLRIAARVDFLVARWLEGCATNAEAAQRSFKSPVSLVLAGCDSGQDKEEAQPKRPPLTIKV